MIGGDGLQHILMEELDRRRGANQLRTRRIIKPVDRTHVIYEGRRYVNFASNNYLGLTHHPRVIEAAAQANCSAGAGSGASALICGYTETHASSERAIAAWKATEAAVLLPSGYQANLAAVQTLAAVHPCRFLVDKLAHASLLDAVRASGCPFRVFPHNHMPKLQRLLEESDVNQMQVVVTESIFSMDGDAADLRELARLKSTHPFVLLLDEAHGSGVYGPGGSGYAAECGQAVIVDVSVVTLSKAIGCGGGAVCGSQAFCESLVNHGRAYIYSTSIPPATAAAVEAAITVMRDEPQRQRRLRSLARQARADLSEVGFRLPPGDSPIIPIVLGAESAALEAAEMLRAKGLLVLAIRPPTVPPNSSRLRLTLCCDHTDGEVELLMGAVRTMKRT